MENSSSGMISKLLEVGSWNLLWWPDLTWHGQFCLPKCAQWMVGKSHQVWARYLQAFGNGTKKPEGGGGFKAPARNRVSHISLFPAGGQNYVNLRGGKFCPPPGISETTGSISTQKNAIRRAVTRSFRKDPNNFDFVKKGGIGGPKTAENQAFFERSLWPNILSDFDETRHLDS